MIDQLNNLKCMLVRNAAFEREVESAIGHPPTATEMGTRVRKYEVFEGVHHQPPRIIIHSKNWSTDNNHGACLESSSQMMTIELSRPSVDEESNPDSLEAQYESVCESIRDICNELTNASYGANNYDDTEYLAELRIECGEVVVDDQVENKINDPSADTPIDPNNIWWCVCQVTPRTF